MKGKRANYDSETGLFVGLTFDKEDPVEELDSVSIAPTEATEVGEEENIADDPDQENGEVDEEEKNEDEEEKNEVDEEKNEDDEEKIEEAGEDMDDDAMEDNPPSDDEMD